MKEASALLGVNVSTLRHWANMGAIKALRTPGGHRRFLAQELSTFARGVQGSPQSRGLNSLERVALVHIRQGIKRSKAFTGAWYHGLDEPGRLRIRGLGRSLLSLLTDYLARSHRRRQVLAEVRRLGAEYGYEFVRDGISLIDALGAFFFFRNSLDEVTLRELRGSAAPPEQAVETWQQLNAFMDEMLLATTKAYEQYRTLLKNGGEQSGPHVNGAVSGAQPRGNP